MLIIEKKGTWFSFQGNRLGQGREAAREELKKNPKLADEIEKMIFAKCKEKGFAVNSKTEKAEAAAETAEV
jgi:recombination protein RecA